MIYSQAQIRAGTDENSKDSAEPTERTRECHRNTFYRWNFILKLETSSNVVKWKSYAMCQVYFIKWYWIRLK